MNYVFASGSAGNKAVRRICACLRDGGDSCTCYGDLASLLGGIAAAGGGIDVFVFDFRLYNVCMDYVHGFVESRGLCVPVVYYNDPLVLPSMRVPYWVGRNEGRFAGGDFSAYLPAFERLSAILDRPEIRPLIDVFQPERPFSAPADGSMGMPPALGAVFDAMRGKRGGTCGGGLTLDEISAHLRSGAMPRSTVYSYISRLKKYIEANGMDGYAVVRTGKGTYRLVVPGDEDE